MVAPMGLIIETNVFANVPNVVTKSTERRAATMKELRRRTATRNERRAAAQLERRTAAQLERRAAAQLERRGEPLHNKSHLNISCFRFSIVLERK